MIRTVHLITNPKGGVGDNLNLANQAESRLSSHQWKVIHHRTEHRGHAEQLATTISLQTNSILCGIGGDGTMHEIINGLMTRQPNERVPVALIPGGTGNSFLEDIGTLSPLNAVDSLTSGQPRQIDLLKVELSGRTRYAFNVCGWGLFASGNLRAESLRWLGQQRYNVAGLMEILRNPVQSSALFMGNEFWKDEYSLIVASNSRYVGKGMLLSPKASFNDGLLDLLYLKKSKRSLLLKLFSKLHRGEHIHMPEVTYLQTDAYEIQSDQETWWNLDGEIEKSTRGKVQVIPSALEWMLPSV